MVEKNFLQKFLKCTSIKLLKWTSTPMGNNEFSSSTFSFSCIGRVLEKGFEKKLFGKCLVIKLVSGKWLTISLTTVSVCYLDAQIGND